MSGKPGTPRFGVPKDMHAQRPSAAGLDVLKTQTGEDFTEQHDLFNPAQISRDPGDAPGKGYVVEDRQYEAPCNHDGFSGGDAHIANLDELDVIRNTVYSVKVKFSDDLYKTYSSDERTA